MLTLFRYTISVILPIVLHVGCSKKKKALVSTTSKSSTISSATKTQEKTQTGNTGSNISKEAPNAPVKPPTKSSDNIKDAKSAPPPAAKPSVPDDKKKKKETVERRRGHLEKTGRKRARRNSCMNTAIGGTIMATVRESSKVSI
ncbi:hypothetical protein L5515_002038 [Caenorhabditis briggsae]|uniref:Lipoprotein n=1 Tax=Caenorhabditis briggsae TaxID=6238 RepID=A0AAE9J3R2_CAEBR|nr:hypothetical protein L5515_002038 [Caenorhabditis briggsae]